MQKHKILKFIILAIFSFIVLIHMYKIVIGIMVYEEQDDRLLAKVFETSRQLFEYRKQHKILPNTLTEAKLNDTICFMWKCFLIKYKVSADKQNFTLAANANYPFVAFACSDRYAFDGSPYHCAGYALVEGYKGSRREPRYNKDKKYFATPSAWPEISHGNFFERYVLLPIW